MFAMLCWTVWSETCKQSHSQGGVLRDFNIDWVYSLLDAFHSSNKDFVIKCEDQNSQEPFWVPPARNHWFFNVDAGFYDVNHMFSVGAMIRDSQGMVRGALASVVRHPESVIRAELIAIRREMALCLSIGL